MNISSIKTPGVYIDEKDAFPPSIANVATAIPAFVGFTEKASKKTTLLRLLLCWSTNKFLEEQQNLKT